MREILIKRVYEAPSASDGRRILVDRLWPRGLSKAVARIDFWARSVSPTNELRKWYAHDPERWDEFLNRYEAELHANPEGIAELRRELAPGRTTFLFSSREERLNNATALRAYLDRHA